MFKKFRTIFAILFILGLSGTLIANEWANYYFPDTLSSYWTYENENGDEFTRYAIEPQDVDGEMHRAFSYDPALEDWADYDYHTRPYFYQVTDDWTAFRVGDDIENATRTVTERQWQEVVSIMKEQVNAQLPEGVSIDLDVTYDLNIQAQDYFYFLPNNATFNEEWEALRIDMQIDLEMELTSNMAGFPPTTQAIAMALTLTETGIIIGTETVDTEAGTFEDCLLITYSTDATIETNPDIPEAKSIFGDAYSGSTTTLWLAPNVGLVKMEQESENGGVGKTLELTNYEINTTASGSSESN